MSEIQIEYTLASYLRACGHFLYYQTGSKAGQQRILVMLLKKGNLTQKELQDILEISSGALSEILQKMEDNQLLERKKSIIDKRLVQLSLTPLGKALALQMKQQYTSTIYRMFECLETQEKIQLGKILEKLVEHLEFLKADPMFALRTEELNDLSPK